MPSADTQFKGKGLGTHDNTRAIAVKLPPDLDQIVRSMGTKKADWLRAAIREKLERDGLLPAD